MFRHKFNLRKRNNYLNKENQEGELSEMKPILNYIIDLRPLMLTNKIQNIYNHLVGKEKEGGANAALP